MCFEQPSPGLSLFYYSDPVCCLEKLKVMLQNVLFSLSFLSYYFSYFGGGRGGCAVCNFFLCFCYLLFVFPLFSLLLFFLVFLKLSFCLCVFYFALLLLLFYTRVHRNNNRSGSIQFLTIEYTRHRQESTSKLLEIGSDCCLLLYDGGHKSLFRWTLQTFCIQLKNTWIQMH